jgi:glycerate kinase
MARALGYRLLDEKGAALSGTPQSLPSVARIDAAMAHPDLAAARMTALCDVQIPLLGPRGAAAIFGPQKGASAGQVTQLEAGLEALAGAVARWKPAGPPAPAERAGAGAAGGLGFGAERFAGAALELGAPYLMDLAGFRERAAAADLVITGEGAFDRQTTEGKLVARILSECARLGRKAVVVAGAWDGSWPAGLAGERLVYTGKWLPGAPEWLGEGHLEALGALAAGPGCSPAGPGCSPAGT